MSGREGRRILMVAYHFPPLRGSSGLHRTLTFSRYLMEDFGWRPTVLTIHPRAYPKTADDQLEDIAAGVEVVRAFGCDTSRHLSIAGRYPLFLALPDNWVSWWFGAVPAGKKIIQRARPDVIWSTFPIATAHMIGHSLHQKSKIPWVADFRDSMTEPGHPPEEKKRDAYLKIEKNAVTHAARVVFTTPGARAMYQERYPDVPDERWTVVANGYDERNFAGAAQLAGNRNDQPTTLVHSGLLYRSERDPRAFFAALGELKRAGEVSGSNLRVVLRASGDEEYHRNHVREHDIEDIVALEDSIPYREALAEMLAADGLLIFQASNCNHQIPAKIYEYLRARRPILALTDPRGDTAGVLDEARAGTVLRLDSKDEIRAGLPRFLEEVRSGRAAIASDEEIARHSRRARTAELARVLEGVVV